MLWNGIASATKDYCHKGDVVGIKGKLQTRTYENENKEKKHILARVKMQFFAYHLSKTI